MAETQIVLILLFIVINHVVRTLLSGLLRKQNGRSGPMNITSLERLYLRQNRTSKLTKLTYGLLTMAKLTRLLMGIKDTDNVRNHRVPKSRIVLIELQSARYDLCARMNIMNINQ